MPSNFNIAPRLFHPNVDSLGQVISNGQEIVTRAVAGNRMRVTGRYNFVAGSAADGGAQAGVYYWVYLSVRATDGADSYFWSTFSQRRTGPGTITFEFTIPSLSAGAKYELFINGVRDRNYASTIREGRQVSVNLDSIIRAPFYTNRRPSAPVIVSPPTGATISYNNGSSSVIPLSWTTEDEDANSGATSSSGLDRGGYQLQVRPAPTLAEPNPAWQAVRGRARGLQASGSAGYWEGEITASDGLPAQYITPGAVPPANNTLGGLGSQNVSGSFFWTKTEVDIVAADLIPYVSGSTSHPQMRNSVAQFQLRPGAWEVRVRSFDMSAHGRTSLTAIDPSSISDWSDSVSLYVTASFLTPSLIDPVGDTTVQQRNVRFEWLFRDPRATGGTQLRRRIRIRRVDGQEIPGMPPTTPPPGNPPPQGTINMVSFPSEDRSAASWYGEDANKYTSAIVTDIPFVGTRAFRYVRANQATNDPIVAWVRGAGIGSFARAPLAAGTAVTYSVYMRPSNVAMRGSVGFKFYNSSGALIGSAINWRALMDLPANTYTRVTHTVTAPAGTVSVDIDAQVNRASGVATALNGDTVHMDGAMMTTGTEVYDFFDGNRVGASWLGTVNGSQSRWDAAPEDYSGGWTEVIPEAQRDSAVDNYTLPGNVLPPGLRYEWQGRTISTPGNFDSGWSESEFFWVAPDDNSGPVVPDPDDIVPGAALGCGNNRVMLAVRGGQRILGEIVGLEQVAWERLRDDISTASFRATVGKGCDDLLQMMRTWQMEIVIFRENENGKRQRVWEGPLTRITWKKDVVEVEARDPMIYLYRRALRHGFNDSYRVVGRKYGPNPANPTGPGIIITPGKVVSQPIAVTLRAGSIIRNAFGYDDPNVLRYLTVLSQPDDAKQSRVVAAYSSSAWQVVDDFAARAGLDYTTVGRRIIVWDTHRSIGRLPEWGDSAFDTEPVVTEYGMQLANHYAVTNGSGVFGTATSESSVDDYGWIEMVSSAYGDDDEAGSDATLSAEARRELVEAFTQQARRNMQDRHPAPVLVRVPDNSMLAPSAEVDINHLVPGVYIPLRSTATLRELVQMQKLDRLYVIQNEDGEAVQVTLSPSGADDAQEEASA